MLPSQPSLLSARERAISYRNADGISECLMGLVLALIGSQDFLQSVFARYGALGRLIPLLAFLVLFPALLLGNHSIAEWFRERLVYPRTGYVAPQEQEDQLRAFRKHVPYAVMVLAFLAGFIFIARIPFLQARWLWAAAIVLPLLYLMIATRMYQTDLLRCALFLVPLVLGLFWWTFSKPTPPISTVGLVLGASLFSSGVVHLFLYLLRNPRPSTPAP